MLARASLLALDKGYELADVSNSFVGEVMEVICWALVNLGDAEGCANPWVKKILGSLGC